MATGDSIDPTPLCMRPALHDLGVVAIALMAAAQVPYWFCARHAGKTTRALNSTLTTNRPSPRVSVPRAVLGSNSRVSNVLSGNLSTSAVQRVKAGCARH